MIDSKKTLCELARDSLIEEFLSSGFTVKTVNDEYIIDLGVGYTIKIIDAYEFSPFLTLIFDEKFYVGALIFLSYKWYFYPYIHNSEELSNLIGPKKILKSHHEVVEFLLEMHRTLEISF